MKRQTKLALIGAGSALAIAIAGTGVASAADTVTKGNNPLSRLLNSLVGKGTITQTQADAIVSAADDMRAKDDAARDARRTAQQKVITDTLGLQWTAIQTRLQNGESLATIAGDKKAALISALVAFEKSQIDADVKSGRLTEAQATTIKANVETRVTNMVNGTGPMGKGMGPMGGRMGDGDGDGDGFGPGKDGFGRGHGRGHHGFDGAPMGTPPTSGSTSNG